MYVKKHLLFVIDYLTANDHRTNPTAIPVANSWSPKKAYARTHDTFRTSTSYLTFQQALLAATQQ